jgi:SagB-type dehydrogenase family enzyme
LVVGRLANDQGKKALNAFRFSWKRKLETTMSEEAPTARDCEIGEQYARRAADVRTIYPPGWQVDWDDAPLRFKLYHGVTRYPLSADIDCSLGESLPLSQPARDFQNGGTEPYVDLSRLLFHTYGLFCSRYLGSLKRADPSHSHASAPDKADKFPRYYTRPVPSGGALYPVELYLYVKDGWSIPSGVYHYDNAHHALALLREGNFDDYVTSCLGGAMAIESCDIVFFPAVFFWKNYFKYSDLSYRLQCLDLGVVLAHLLLVSRRFGLSAEVFFQFLDEPVDHLLGLDPRQESVYAVLPMNRQQLPSSAAYRSSPSLDGIDRLISQLPRIEHQFVQKSALIKSSEMIDQLHLASMSSRPGAVQQRLSSANSADSPSIVLPSLPQVSSRDLAETLHSRHSAFEDFRTGWLTPNQLSILLSEATRPFASDLDLLSGRNQPTELYCIVNHVKEIAPGAYRYDPDNHRLWIIAQGDMRWRLQTNYTMSNINMFQISVAFFMVGDYSAAFGACGNRGYRIQNIGAGIVIQRLYTASAAQELSCHALLGMDVKGMDDLLELGGSSLTTLMAVVVGHEKPYRLEHSHKLWF